MKKVFVLFALFGFIFSTFAQPNFDEELVAIKSYLSFVKLK